MSAAEQVRQFTVADDDDGIRLDRWFRRNLPQASFGTVARWARTGQLRLDGKRVSPGERIGAGQEIRIPPAEVEPPRSSPARPRREPLSGEETEFVRSLVIHEDGSRAGFQDKVQIDPSEEGTYAPGEGRRMFRTARRPAP